MKKQMKQTDKVYCPHLQERIEVHECFFCFDKHGFLNVDGRGNSQ